MMKKKLRHRNVRLQGLALLLSVVLLFVYMPIAAVAETIADLAATEEVPVEEVYEVTALREAGVKHFYVGEGKYTAVSYGEAVHRQDATGTWQEIDNTLTLQNGKYQTGDGRVQLAATNGRDNLLQLTENGYSIGLSFATGGADNTAPYALQSVNTTAATVQNATREAVVEGDSPAVQYEKLSRVLNRSSLQYANLLANTDVRYTLHGNDITGRITLRGARESYNVALRLQLTGLTPSLDEAGNVILSDATTGTAVYTIPAPGVSTPGLVAAYQLLPVSDGLYLLGIATTPVLDDNISTEDFGSLTPGGENTAVTLSFGVVTGTGTISSGGFNACGYISSEYYNADFRDVEELYFENDNIGYVLMGIPTLMPETTFVSAELSVWYSQSPPFSSGDDNVDNGMDYTIVAYKATVPWYSVDTWTYSIAEADYSNFGLAYTPLDTSVGMENDTYVDFDVSDAVEDWYGGESNHGFGFICTDNVNSFYFCNRELAPELTVTYQYTTVNIPTGVYYLQNAQFLSCLASAASPTTQNGTIYETALKFYENADAQKWLITSLGNGFHKIQSVATGGVLTACGASVSQGIEVRPAVSGSNAQQWRIIDEGDGGYRIASKIHYNALYHAWGLCIGTSNDGLLPDRDVYLDSNINNFNQRKSWYLKSVSEMAEDVVGLSVETGLYYIKNAQYEALIQIDNDDDPYYTTEGANLELWGSDGAKYQQWRFIYQFDGYYIIQSEQSGKVLTVQAGMENQDQKALIQATDTGSSRQRWKVVATSGGRYKILAKSGEAYNTDWCVAASEGIIIHNDKNVQQCDYVNDTNYRDEWVIFTYRHKVRLNVLYEEAYLDRHSDASDRILEELQDLQEFYFDNFNIYIDYSDPQLFTSIADEQCSTDSDAECTHCEIEECKNSTFQHGTHGSYHGFLLEELHHSNIQNIAYHAVADLYSENGNYMNETLTVIFIGRKVCARSEEYHHESVVGEYYDDINTLAVAHHGSQSSETKVLIHEFGHAYGIEDHYGGSALNTNQMNIKEGVSHYHSLCLYGEWEGALTTAHFCEGCNLKMMIHIDKFQHELLGE